MTARRRLTVWLPVAAWMGVIFFLSAQPDLPHPPSGWPDWAFSNAAHLFMFAVLAMLWPGRWGRAGGRG